MPNRTIAITPPPGMLPIQIDKPSTTFSPPPTNQCRPQTTGLSSRIPLMDQMKTLSVSSTTTSSRPVSTVSYLSEYEVVDTSTQAIKKPLGDIASFPPRQNASLFTSVTPTNDKPLSTFPKIPKTDTINGHYSSSSLNDHSWLQSKSNVNNKNEILNNQQRATPTPTPSCSGLTTANTE